MAQIHVIAGATGTPVTLPVRKIGIADLRGALKSGFEDFLAMPTQVLFLCLIYPLVGLFLGGLSLGYNMLPLFFPLAAGFALVGPLAALGVYEMSRRREAGREAQWTDAFDVLRSPSIGAIAALGILLMILFLTWLWAAQQIYELLFGVLRPASLSQFVSEVLTTPQGWQLIAIGCGVGFLFAVVALAVSVVSFPLLLDRDVGAAAAVTTSLRAIAKNPIPMAAWGLIVAALLLLGSLPFFAGLAVVIPILGHATWHLYRRVVPR